MDPYSKQYNSGFQDPYSIQMPIQQYPTQFPRPTTYVTQLPQQTATAVFTTAPSSNVMVLPRPAYKDYLWLSILNMIFCCLPIGIAALVYSCKTRDSLDRGDLDLAASDSRTAFILNMVALGVGIAVSISWIGYVIYYIAAVVAFTQNYGK